LRRSGRVLPVGRPVSTVALAAGTRELLNFKGWVAA
jgi:hypothetical protein